MGTFIGKCIERPADRYSHCRDAIFPADSGSGHEGIRARSHFSYGILLRIGYCDRQSTAVRRKRSRVGTEARWNPDNEIRRVCSPTARYRRRARSSSTSSALPVRMFLFERHERHRVVRVHGNDQLPLDGVVAHGRRARNSRCNDLRGLAPADSGDAAETHAAHVLRTILGDDHAVVPAFHGVLGPQQLASRLKVRTASSPTFTTTILPSPSIASPFGRFNGAPSTNTDTLPSAVTRNTRYSFRVFEM